MDEDVLSIYTAQHGLNHFKNSNLEVDDLPRSDRSLELNVDFLKQLIEDLRLTSRHLTEQLRCSHRAVEKRLDELSKPCR